MTKKLLSFMLALALVLILPLPTLAAENTMAFIDGLPSSLEEVETDSGSSDTHKVMEITRLLFETKRNQIANEQSEDYDFAPFWSTNVANAENINYFVSSVMARKKSFASAGMRASNSRVELTFHKIEINSHTAVIDVYEWFAFTYYFIENNTAMDEESGEGLPYRITLKKVNENWRISDIEFSDLTFESLRDPSLSVEAFVKGQREVAAACIPYETVTAEPIDPQRLPSRKALDTSRFVTYAKKYAGSNRSSLFCDYTTMGGDCQNYASQCIWYGLGGVESSTAVNNYNFPMVGPSSSNRRWYNDRPGNHTGSWTVVGSFADYVVAGDTSFVGLYGTVTNGVANAQVGDIIQIRKIGETSFCHSYVVISVTGSAGRRTADNIWVCAHTKDVSNVILSGQVDSTYVYRTVHVGGIYN